MHTHTHTHARTHVRTCAHTNARTRANTHTHTYRTHVYVQKHRRRINPRSSGRGRQVVDSGGRGRWADAHGRLARLCAAARGTLGQLPGQQSSQPGLMRTTQPRPTRSGAQRSSALPLGAGQQSNPTHSAVRHRAQNKVRRSGAKRARLRVQNQGGDRECGNESRDRRSGAKSA